MHSGLEIDLDSMWSPSNAPFAIIPNSPFVRAKVHASRCSMICDDAISGDQCIFCNEERSYFSRVPDKPKSSHEIIEIASHDLSVSNKGTYQQCCHPFESVFSVH